MWNYVGEIITKGAIRIAEYGKSKDISEPSKHFENRPADWKILSRVPTQRLKKKKILRADFV